MDVMRQDRRSVLRLLAAGACTALGAPVLGQGGPHIPAHPIVLWVPWPAGGATDITMRILGDLAGRNLGQKVLTETVPVPAAHW